ncbi:MAG: cellulase family glycosylhydrolase [Mycobacteriales bacterium]
MNQQNTAHRPISPMLRFFIAGGCVIALLAVLVGAYLVLFHDKSGGGRGGAGDVKIDVSGGLGMGNNSAPPAFGVQFHGTWNAYYQGTTATPNAMFGKQLDRLAANRVTLLRVDIGWSASQPNPGTPNAKSSYNQRIALVLKEAHRRNMQVMLTIWRTPDWARSSSSSPVEFPTDPRAFGQWATWAARTYGRSVFAWQIWNEPNIVEFTGIKEDDQRAVKYVPLLKAGFEGIHKGDPSAKVIFGGPAQNDDAFIRQCYQLGAKDYFDIMAVHPYEGDQRRPPETPDPGQRYYTTHFAVVAQVMAEFGDGQKPVWWTEFGYSVHSNANVPSTMSWKYGVETPQISGDYLRRAFELARTQYPQVKAIFVYTAYRVGNDPYGHESGYSLLNADGTAKAQLTILSQYMAGFDSYRRLD